MAIELYECREKGDWDALVEQSLNNTLFHSWEWLKIMEKHSGARMHALVARLGSNDVGLLPVFSKKSRGFRFLFSPPPKSGLLYLGPLFIRYDKVLKLQTIEKTMLSFNDALNTYLKGAFKPNYIRLATTPGYGDSRPLTWNDYTVTPEYTYVLDLSGGEDAVFKNFQKQVRVDIKKTVREGVTVREGGKNEIKLIHESLSDRLIQQGEQTNKSLEYLLDL